jgi:integrase
MKLKLVAAISALAIPALAHAQQGGPQPKVPKPTKADAQNMFAELSTARLLLIRSPAERCEHSASINARAQGQHFVFGSERGAPLSAPASREWSNVQGVLPNLELKWHAHMLRHACGYALANAGHDTRALQAYLGHANIQNTTRYTALDRFKGFWRD